MRAAAPATWLLAGSVLVAFLAVMTAMWSFANARPIWGLYNIAILLVALAVSIAIRARSLDT